MQQTNILLFWNKKSLIGVSMVNVVQRGKQKVWNNDLISM
jgi:hypothetical protein